MRTFIYAQDLWWLCILSSWGFVFRLLKGNRIITIANILMMIIIVQLFKPSWHQHAYSLNTGLLIFLILLVQRIWFKRQETSCSMIISFILLTDVKAEMAITVRRKKALVTVRAQRVTISISKEWLFIWHDYLTIGGTSKHQEKPPNSTSESAAWRNFTAKTTESHQLNSAIR